MNVRDLRWGWWKECCRVKDSNSLQTLSPSSRTLWDLAKRRLCTYSTVYSSRYFANDAVFPREFEMNVEWQMKGEEEERERTNPKLPVPITSPLAYLYVYSPVNQSLARWRGGERERGGKHTIHPLIEKYILDDLLLMSVGVVVEVVVYYSSFLLLWWSEWAENDTDSCRRFFYSTWFEWMQFISQQSQRYSANALARSGRHEINDNFDIPLNFSSKEPLWKLLNKFRFVVCS